MKTKTFDCVEMKRRGARRIEEATAGMSLAERAEYWRQRDAALRQEQEAAKRARAEAGAAPARHGEAPGESGKREDVIDAGSEEKK